MEKTLFEVGLEERKATLGEKYVTDNLANADDFSKPFQEMMTAVLHIYLCKQQQQQRQHQHLRPCWQHKRCYAC